MPRCEGRPEGPCPDGRNDNSVHGTQGDLMLCHACDEYRFPTLRSDTRLTKPSKQSAVASTVVEKKSVHTKSTSECDVGVGSVDIHGDMQQSPSIVEDVEVTTRVELQRTSQSSDKLMHSTGIILNDILCFVKNKYNNYHAAVIKATILDFYREYEIIHAKQVLVQSASNISLLSAIQQYAKGRKGDNKLKSTVDDIVHIWEVLDEQNVIDHLPVFCTCDTSRIAVIPDELTDLSYVRKIIDELKQQVHDLTNIVTHLCSQHEKSCCSRNALSRKVCGPADNCKLSSLSDRVPNGESTDSSNGHSRADQPSLNSMDVITDSVSSVHRGTPTNDMSGNSHYSHSANASSSVQLSTNYSDAARSHPPAVKNTEDMDSGFKPVVNKKKSRHPVIGNCRSSGLQFQGVAKKYVFCLNRLQPDTTVDTVSDFLKSHGISVISCYVVKKRSNIGEDEVDVNDEYITPRFISMRICVYQSDVKKIYDPDLWPAGVTVRPWSFKQRTS